MRREMLEHIALHTRAVSEQIGKDELAQPVVQAMLGVLRHEFVPHEIRRFAYFDSPLPIGFGKTMSQPFIVALMTDLLDVNPDDRILEVGTGLGYHTAVLAKLADTVYSIEIIEELAQQANKRLARQACENVKLRIGDGSRGWPDEAPFDKIMIAAAPELIPTALLAQLKPGGIMVVPAGIEDAQQLMVVRKSASGDLSTQEVLPVRFSALEISH
ncbi:MAG: protein-L-isoaspartate(D-aspartate) O-methyltransferase [Gammaproteobacteria bacterium]